MLGILLAAALAATLPRAALASEQSSLSVEVAVIADKDAAAVLAATNGRQPIYGTRGDYTLVLIVVSSKLKPGDPPPEYLFRERPTECSSDVTEPCCSDGELWIETVRGWAHSGRQCDAIKGLFKDLPAPIPVDSAVVTIVTRGAQVDEPF